MKKNRDMTVNLYPVTKNGATTYKAKPRHSLLCSYLVSYLAIIAFLLLSFYACKSHPALYAPIIAFLAFWSNATARELYLLRVGIS